MMNEPVLELLWKRITQQFRLGPTSIHGPDHWKRVEGHGILLARGTAGADLLVVRLFAVFHDSQRWDDLSDWQHGPRAAEFLQEVHGDWFEVSPRQLDLLYVACRDHTEGETSNDPTIGCCWDSDRLDLPRVGIMPHQDLMSTFLGKNLASQSSGWRRRSE